MAQRGYQKWTISDREALLALLDMGFGPVEIARKMNRPYSTVVKRVKRYGCAAADYTRWTDEEVKIADEMVRDGYTSVAISAVTGRSRRAIEHKFPDAGLRMNVQKRRKLVASLTDDGLSIAATAKAVGISEGSVYEALRILRPKRKSLRGGRPRKVEPEKAPPPKVLSWAEWHAQEEAKRQHAPVIERGFAIHDTWDEDRPIGAVR